MNTIYSNDMVIQVRQMEKRISSHPCVEDVVVITVDDPQKGQYFRVIIETKCDPATTEQSLLDLFKEKTNLMKAPLSIVFAKIPRTPTGKVSRQLLLSQAGLM
ncbi:MAG: hypothetical protein AB1815_02205 [Bacillota bacterium]